MASPWSSAAPVARPVRRARRTLGLLLAVPGLPGLLVLLASPAFAAATQSQTASGAGDIGDVHSPAPQSPLQLIALYLGIPLAGFVIAYLLSLRSGRKSDRYRPGQPWTHDAAWFGSSAQESEAAQEQRRRAALPGAGGASGRW